MDVVIVGAGVGGLTTALMLHEQGIKPRIFEQAAEVRELGVGINILPHSVKPLADLGLLDRLDNIAMRTRKLRYLTKHGQEVWSELRGLHAGHDVPQFSIHRGKLQKMLYDTVIERLGPESIQTGNKLATFIQDEGGVTSHFVNSIDGGSSRTVRSEIMICADGIHSAARKVFYPDQGSPSWQGVVMWRGSAEWPVWEDGETMVIAGGLGGKLVLYPITPQKDGKQLMNWVVNIRVADSEVSPPPEDSWSKQPHLQKFCHTQSALRSMDLIWKQ
jgi:2-polyprenyl-6-methoxyphenol hydroxylase-like FAD-dependent oxidoreductase